VIVSSSYDCFSLPLQIGVALYLLYTQVKFAFLSGLAITILLIPGTIQQNLDLRTFFELCMGCHDDIPWVAALREYIY
jgi:hypothetical protein